MPIGCSRSSARWATSPAVRAMSTKPRTDDGGSPTSTSAAPPAPAPLIGSAGPDARSDASATSAQQPEVRPEQALLGRELVEARRAGIAVAVHGMAEPGHARAAARGAAATASSAIAAQRGVVGDRRQPAAERVGEELRGVAGRSEEHAARTEQPRGDRALHRLGRAGVGEAGRQRARREPVVGQRHEHGVEHASLARRSAPAA